MLCKQGNSFSLFTSSSINDTIVIQAITPFWTSGVQMGCFPYGVKDSVGININKNRFTTLCWNLLNYTMATMDNMLIKYKIYAWHNEI